MENPTLRTIITCLAIMFISILQSQDICFDGNYCPFPGDGTAPADPTPNTCGTGGTDEYGNAEFIFDPGTDIGAGGTCDILTLFVSFEDDGNVYLSFIQANQGQACYSFYFNTDCDATTGFQDDLLDPNDPVQINGGGADLRFLVCVQQDNVLDPVVETWDGTMFVPNGVNSIQGLAGLTDGCGGSNEAFVETQIPLNDLFDPCDPMINCGELQLTTFLTFAGGSFNAQQCDVTVETIQTEVPAEVVASLAIVERVCPNTDVTFDASATTGGPNLTYEWDFDGDGVIDLTTNTPDPTFNFPMTGMFDVTVIVTDPESMCTGMDSATITLEVCEPTDSTCGCDIICDAVPPVITVTENTCDPIMDGFYNITTDCGDGFVLEFSTDGGMTFTSMLPTYPTPFIARCVGEACAVLDISGLDTSNDAVDEVNNGNVMIGEAVVTINQTFNGTSTLDENEITNSQTTPSGGPPGPIGISSGVSHECIENVCGELANSMNNIYNFSVPVCDFTIELWDLDRDDEMLLTASGPNGPVTYTINTIGAGVNNSGNSFYSNDPTVNYPGGGAPTLGMFSVTFDDCITSISIDYFDRSDTAGNGGSYTIVFDEGCTFTDCISEEVSLVGTPITCVMCPEDITAVLAPVDPTCLGTSISFDATGSTGQNVEYQWDFENDGVIDAVTTVPMTSFTYAMAGTFTVALTIVDPTGECDPASTSIELEICESVEVICPDPVVEITDGESISPDVLGSPLIATNACTPIPNASFDDVSAPGQCPFEEIITRTYTITDNCGTTECVQTINVLVDNPAAINALPINDQICLGESITLDASASIGDGLTYCWNVGIGTVGCDYTTATAMHTYVAPGTYDVSLEIMDQFGCSDTQVIGTVTVFEGPEAIGTVDFDPCTLTLTFDASASVDNFPPSNLIYTWDFGDGNTSGDVTGTHVFENCDVASTITLTVVDPDVPFPACNSDQLVFTVETDEEPPVLVCPPISELQCGEPIPTFASAAELIAAGGQASDNCGIVQLSVISQDTIEGVCPYIFQVSVTYEASDICGNSSTCTQFFNLLPDEPMAIFPPNIILSCGDDVSEGTLGTPTIVESMCALPATFSSSEVLISGSCPGDATIERTFTITDDCGNTIQQTQIITIVNDITPTLEGPPDITIDCTASCDPSATGGIAVAVDFCMPIDGSTNEVTITFEDEFVGFDGTGFPGGVVGFIIRTFTAVDGCGNTATYVQTISVEQGDGSVLTCNDRINVSLNSDCEGITPDFLLEAPEDTKYFLSLGNGQIGFAENDQSIFEGIDFSELVDLGVPVSYTLTDLCGNSCWGEIFIEANVLPQFESPCNFVAGNTIDESGSIGSDDDTNLNDLLSFSDNPARGADLIGTVVISDVSCQDAFVIGNSSFKYNAAPNGADLDVQFVDLELYFINTEDESVITVTLPTGVINVTPLVDLVQTEGTYDVYVSTANASGKGDYSIHIEVSSCLPPCTTICGSDFPDEFITPDEIEDILDDRCNATLIGDLIINTETRGDMCDGIVHIQTITGQFNLHGETIKEEIITQAYVELPIDLDEIVILAPNPVMLDCGDDVTPEAILELTEDGKQAYPHYFDFNQPIQDTICLEEVIVHFDVPIDTVQELVIVEGLWVLVDIVKKERRDSMRCVREGPNPIPQFEPILLSDNQCNVIVDFSDVVFDACGTGSKIVRGWSIIDWCQESAQITLTQSIDVVDDVAPTIEKVDDVTLSVDPWTCAAVYPLPDLVHTDNCEGSVITESWSVSEGRVVDGFAVDLWQSDEPIEGFLTVSDDCGNVSRDTVLIVVTDQVPPVPVCNNAITVSITSAMLNDNGGGATIQADAFDGGSHDGACGEVTVQVRRLTGCCFDQDCEPVYECSSLDIKTGECVDSILVAGAPLFGDFVKFCCEDIGDIVTVEVQVTDKAGNTNHCTVSVEVEDKTQSSLICETVVVSCDEDVTSLDGPILSETHCQLNETQIILLNDSEISGACGTDQIIREWFIDRDGSGDFSSGDPFCEQIILIDQSDNGFNPSSIKWPRHFNGEIEIGQNIECNDDEVVVTDGISVEMGAVQVCSITEDDYSQPVWCATSCSLIASSVEQDTLFSSDACFKLINRWTVIDWCTWDSNGSGIDDDNDSSSDRFIAVEDWAQSVCTECPENSGAIADNPVYFAYLEVEEDGYYTFDQIIKVIDDSAPVIDAPSEVIVQTTGGADSKTDATSCKGEDTITARVTDFCGDNESGADLIRWQATVYRNDLPIDIQIGSGSIIEISTGLGSPGDIHIIEWIARDGCGNETVATTSVGFGDETIPSPICIAAVSTSIPDGAGEVLVWPSDLDLGSFDNCTDADDLRFVIVGAGVDPIRPGEAGFEDQGSFVISCDDLSSFVPVDMWVFDANGNGDFCQSSIQISNGCGIDNTEGVEQGASNFSIAGQVFTEAGDPVSNTLVTVNSNQSEFPKSVVVDDEGGYLFTRNAENFSYDITLENDRNHSNGVSTFDLLRMQQHIIQTNVLDSPYKIIAADIDFDGKISVADIVEGRRLVLGLIEQFEFNESWRFVYSEFQFLDGTNNPWPFTENRFIISLDDDSLNNDFIGVKIGDLNNTANASEIVQSEIRHTEYETLTTHINEHNPHQLMLSFDSEVMINSVQFGLYTSGNQLMSIQSTDVAFNNGNYIIADSHAAISWNSSDGYGKPFSLVLEFAQPVTTNDLAEFKLNTSRLHSELSVEGQDELKNISLRKISESSDVLQLFQNSPNPFTKQSIIEFNLPKASSSVTLRIYDTTGKELFRETGAYSSGKHQTIITADQLKGSGTYYYQIISEELTETKAMMLIK